MQLRHDSSETGLELGANSRPLIEHVRYTSLHLPFRSSSITRALNDKQVQWIKLGYHTTARLPGAIHVL